MINFYDTKTCSEVTTTKEAKEIIGDIATICEFYILLAVKFPHKGTVVVSKPLKDVDNVPEISDDVWDSMEESIRKLIGQKEGPLMVNKMTLYYAFDVTSIKRTLLATGGIAECVWEDAEDNYMPSVSNKHVQKFLLFEKFDNK